LDSTNQQYELVGGSRILFELKSKNNVVLKSDVSSVNQRNGIATCFVEILENPKRTFKEVEDGAGKLTIVGSLQNKSNTENPISEKFIGAMNYRCIFPINIAKNILNADSPFILQTQHTTETIKGQFSFAKAAVSPLKTSAVGLTYNSATGLPKTKLVTTSIGKATS
jgi:hypothetical protein